MARTFVVEFLRDKRVKPLLDDIAAALQKCKELSEDEVWAIIHSRYETAPCDATNDGDIPLWSDGGTDNEQ